jgi:hypothetical protein
VTEVQVGEERRIDNVGTVVNRPAYYFYGYGVLMDVEEASNFR